MALLKGTGREKKRIKTMVSRTNDNTSCSQYEVDRIGLSYNNYKIL